MLCSFETVFERLFQFVRINQMRSTRFVRQLQTESIFGEKQLKRPSIWLSVILPTNRYEVLRSHMMINQDHTKFVHSFFFPSLSSKYLCGPHFFPFSSRAGSTAAMVTDDPFISQAAAISLCFVAILYGELVNPRSGRENSGALLCRHAPCCFSCCHICSFVRGVVFTMMY